MDKVLNSGVRTGFDNWNNALAHSLRILVALGDDDALMPHYFGHWPRLLVRAWRYSYRAYLYAYRVLSGIPADFSNFCNPLFKSEQLFQTKRDGLEARPVLGSALDEVFNQYSFSSHSRLVEE
jgi:hypothetical protein